MMPTMLRIETKAYTKPMVSPVVTAHGTLENRLGRWVCITLTTGQVGWGDAAPLRGFGPLAEETFPGLEDAIQELQGQPLPNRGSICVVLDRLTLAPSARAALEVAMLDAHAQLEGCSLAQWLSDDAHADVGSHVFVRNTGDAKKALDHGASTLKVKVGSQPVGDDVAWVMKLRDMAPECRLRLDVNGGWSRSEARFAMARLQSAGPIFFEQPLAWSDLEGCRELRENFDVSIALDESVIHCGSAAIDASLADAIVLKPMFIGGLLPTMALAEMAHSAGLATWVTHAMASPVDYASALHCAAAIGSGPHGFLDGAADLPLGGRIELQATHGHGGRL